MCDIANPAAVTKRKAKTKCRDWVWEGGQVEVVKGKCELFQPFCTPLCEIPLTTATQGISEGNAEKIYTANMQSKYN